MIIRYFEAKITINLIYFKFIYHIVDVYSFNNIFVLYILFEIIFNNEIELLKLYKSLRF